MSLVVRTSQKMVKDWLYVEKSISVYFKFNCLNISHCTWLKPIVNTLEIDVSTLVKKQSFKGKKLGNFCVVFMFEIKFILCSAAAFLASTRAAGPRWPLFGR